MSKFEFVKKYKDCGLSLPTRATAYSAGYDICAAKDTLVPPYQHLMETLHEVYIIDKNDVVTLDEAKNLMEDIARPTLVPTGLKCKLAPNQYLKLVPRSSLPLKHWIICANSEGIIDSDYYNNESNEGEIFFQVINLSPWPILIQKGEKICQGIIQTYDTIEDDAAKGERSGGFGSTSQ